MSGIGCIIIIHPNPVGNSRFPGWAPTSSLKNQLIFTMSIQLSSTGKPKRVHGDQLKPCYLDAADLPQNWLNAAAPEEQVENDSSEGDNDRDLSLEREFDDSSGSEDENPGLSPVKVTRRGRVVKAPKIFDL